MKKARMNICRMGVLAGVFALGCGTVEKPDADHGGAEALAADTTPMEKNEKATQKPGAPVAIEGSVSGSSAMISLIFESEGSDVTVEVWGVDGLVVTSEKSPIRNRRVRAGEKIEVSVSFSAPATRADLAVRARGTFGGNPRERVRSFGVNTGAPSTTKQPGEIRIGPDGRPVRVMKPN